MTSDIVAAEQPAGAPPPLPRLLRPPEPLLREAAWAIHALGTSMPEIDAVYDLLLRCSPRDRLMRAGTTRAQRALPWLLPKQPGDIAVAAYAAADERLIGVANLMANDAESSEVAVIVDPAWRSQGIGRRMCLEMLGLAPTVVIATIDTSNAAARRLAARFTNQAPSYIDGTTVEYVVRVAELSRHHHQLADHRPIGDALHRPR